MSNSATSVTSASVSATISNDARASITQKGPNTSFGPFVLQCLFAELFCAVCGAVFAFGETLQFAAYEFLAQGRQTVGEDFALQVVVLVLDYASGITIIEFVVFNPIFIHIADAD